MSVATEAIDNAISGYGGLFDYTTSANELRDARESLTAAYVALQLGPTELLNRYEHAGFNRVVVIVDTIRRACSLPNFTLIFVVYYIKNQIMNTKIRTTNVCYAA